MDERVVRILRRWMKGTPWKHIRVQQLIKHQPRSQTAKSLRHRPQYAMIPTAKLAKINVPQHHELSFTNSRWTTVVTTTPTILSWCQRHQTQVPRCLSDAIYHLTCQSLTCCFKFEFMICFWCEETLDFAQTRDWSAPYFF